jgi:hypothetical protein
MIDCSTHYVCQEITVERCWSGAIDVDEEVQPKVKMAWNIPTFKKALSAKRAVRLGLEELLLRRA